jgi:uncharacterized LabA/DUF88 family protein
MSNRADAPRYAVLIDADNASAALVGGMLAEVAKFGVAGIKRAYGDWTTPNLGRWKETLLEHSIQPIQQFRYTTGKNATDSALIIDAMDLLHGEQLQGAAIVSSDSDFTRLAQRMREAGLHVLGIGERKTPRPFVAACDRFVYTDLLDREAGEASEVHAVAKGAPDASLLTLLRSAVEAAQEEDGWAHLGEVGNQISRIQPEFDPRSHGHARLSQLFESLPDFEIKRTPIEPGGNMRVEVRRAQEKQAKKATTRGRSRRRS